MCYQGPRTTPSTLAWGGHTRDGLSFAIAPHSLKRPMATYQFLQIEGGTPFHTTSSMGSSTLMATAPCLQKCSRRRLLQCTLPRSGSSDLLERLTPRLQQHTTVKHGWRYVCRCQVKPACHWLGDIPCSGIKVLIVNKF